nr:ABC transporter permease [Desulfovibrio sp. ZJ369]
METSPQVTASVQGSLLQISVGGQWRMETPWPEEADDALADIADQRVREVRLAAADLGPWDTSLLVFLVQIVTAARSRKVPVHADLPDGLARLLQLAFAVPPQEGAARKDATTSFLSNLGESVLKLPPKLADFLSFLGEITLAVWHLFLGRAKMRSQDFVAAMYESGVQALPIISVTSLLFGLILAFVGAVQLTQFGAQIYVAGLVGIGMLRVMGAVMVGVVMSGRVGAAYAALIGTMQVNEEVDALSTLGISPVDFLVLPRVLALTLMVPLLTLYADLMGVLGGYLVGTLMLDLNPLEYLNATTRMVPFHHVIIGLVYGTVFGVIIAVAGCYQGMRCGRSAQAVGLATTTAVVHAIVGIIVATAVITVICNVLGV